MMSNLFLGKGNLFWGMQFAPFSHKTALDRQSVLSRLFRVKTAQSHTAITSIVIRCTNQLRIKRESTIIRHCEANRRFAKAIQKNNTTESRPIRGAKNRIQTSSSASADFLLESGKRGSPPKSEKRQLLARRGSGAGGAALLRKEKCESESKKIVGDSQVAKMDSSRCRAQNDESCVDCHENPTDFLAMTQFVRHF